MESTDALRTVNPEGVRFPPFGSPPLEVFDWARIFGVSEATVLRWLAEHGIKFKPFGRCRLITPDDMWACMPYGNAPVVEPEPPPPKRKRKG